MISREDAQLENDEGFPVWATGRSAGALNVVSAGESQTLPMGTVASQEACRALADLRERRTFGKLVRISDGNFRRVRLRSGLHGAACHV